ncbi:uncharacterized protein PGTG_22100 [Puccinia graminis f. sp. tritici CRL 75-36-700-3]|uniref:Uncharacterized protein n=1 Tax=Puccinia graminis f. sp. tritici (strain CRL 75-36-700-3 / race SCCL) TaxID=418459 RepID=H6QTA0_PUCGT|nr:uncharacterized protein PGTG_22100 [Puccinia graminis f. sp. tritici CRL 75-36-700-3]EHS64045.1 hypothetical protein PGTG_22100 [Puccinia graminis f. sp. tritici CRL 75-36-700-3]
MSRLPSRQCHATKQLRRSLALLRHPLGQTAHPQSLGQMAHPIILKDYLCPSHQRCHIFRSTSSNNPTGCTWLWRPLIPATLPT